MLQGLQFCLAFFCTIISKFSGELNYKTNLQRNHSVLLTQFSPRIPVVSSSPSNLRKISSQLQWLNYKTILQDIAIVML